MGGRKKRQKTIRKQRKITTARTIHAEKGNDSSPLITDLSASNESTLSSSEFIDEQQLSEQSSGSFDEIDLASKVSKTKTTRQQSRVAFTSTSSHSLNSKPEQHSIQKGQNDAAKEFSSKVRLRTELRTDKTFNGNTCQLYSLRFSNHTQMLVEGVPIVAVRTLFSIISPLPIGVVSLHTLYCRAHEKIASRSRRFHTKAGQFFIFNGIADGKLFHEEDFQESSNKKTSSCQNTRKNAQLKHSAENGLHEESKTREKRIDAIITSTEVISKGKYRVCSVNGFGVCQCRTRAHSLSLEEVKTFSIYSKFHQGKTYYIYGFARFRKKRQNHSATSKCDGFCLLVSIDGHLFAVQNDFIAAIKFFHEMTVKELKQFDPMEINQDYRRQSPEVYKDFSTCGFDLNTIICECQPVQPPALSEDFMKQMGNFVHDKPSILDTLKYRNKDAIPIVINVTLKYQTQSINVLIPTKHPIPPFALDPCSKHALAQTPQTKCCRCPSFPAITKMIGSKAKHNRETLYTIQQNQEENRQENETNSKVLRDEYIKKKNNQLNTEQDEERQKTENETSKDEIEEMSFFENDSTEPITETDSENKIDRALLKRPTIHETKAQKIELENQNDIYFDTNNLSNHLSFFEKLDQLLLPSLSAYKSFTLTTDVNKSKKAKTVTRSKISKYITEGSRLAHFFQTHRFDDAENKNTDNDTFSEISSLSTEDETDDVYIQPIQKPITRKRSRRVLDEKTRAESEQYRKKLRTRKTSSVLEKSVQNEKTVHNKEAEHNIKHSNESYRKKPEEQLITHKLQSNKQRVTKVANKLTINKDKNEDDHNLVNSVNKPDNFQKLEQNGNKQQNDVCRDSDNDTNYDSESMDIDTYQEQEPTKDNAATFKAAKDNEKTVKNLFNFTITNTSPTQNIEQNQKKNKTLFNKEYPNNESNLTSLLSPLEFAEVNKPLEQTSTAKMETEFYEQIETTDFQKSNVSNEETNHQHLEEQYTVPVQLLHTEAHHNQPNIYRRTEIQQAIKPKLQAIRSSEKRDFGKRFSELRIKLYEATQMERQRLTKQQMTYLKDLLDKLSLMEQIKY